MTTVLLVIHMVVTLALIGVVLIQRSEGGGLGIGTTGGMGSFMGGRGTTNLLTRTTAVLAAIFMVPLAFARAAEPGNGGRRPVDPGRPDARAGRRHHTLDPVPGAAPGGDPCDDICDHPGDDPGDAQPHERAGAGGNRAGESRAARRPRSGRTARQPLTGSLPAGDVQGFTPPRPRPM